MRVASCSRVGAVFPQRRNGRRSLRLCTDRFNNRVAQGKYVMNLDEGNRWCGGRDMTVLGNEAN
jgi:hypothetical protein